MSAVRVFLVSIDLRVNWTTRKQADAIDTGNTKLQPQ